MRSWALAPALLSTSLVLGCGTSTPAEGLNAPCTRTSDCIGGLACLGGSCNPEDGGMADGAQADAISGDGSGLADGSTGD